MSQPSPKPNAASSSPPHLSPADQTRQQLPSGRSILIKAGQTDEQIELRSADGQTELRITMTEDGPIVTLIAAKLEIESSHTVSVNCARFEVNTQDAVAIRSQGDVTIQSDADTHLKSGAQTFIDGDYVNLNCLDRTGYHDQDSCEAGETPPQLTHQDQPASESIGEDESQENPDVTNYGQ